MLKVYVEREVFQEAETAAMMAVIEPPDDEDCLNLPSPGIGETYKDCAFLQICHQTNIKNLRC